MPDQPPVAVPGPASEPEVKQRDGAWFVTHAACRWKIAVRDEGFARELASEHRCPASVSPADTPAYKRLTAMLAEGEGLDDGQPMYSPLGELRAFAAEFAALLAVGERDRQQIARLTEALAGLVASMRYRPPRSDWLAWRSECIDAASKLLAEEDIARAEKMFLHAADFDDLNPAAVLAGEEDAGNE